MEVFNILINDDPILRNESKKVTKITKDICKLLTRMEMTMRKADGVGLAAPQVGFNIRVAIVDVGDGLIELINPVIISAEGNQCGEEGCLSLPGLTGEVARFNIVTVKATDRKGKLFSITAEGLKARAIQHEIDHLDGILFKDKALETRYE